jgi:hypothetical protein
MANVFNGHVFYTNCSQYYKFLSYFGEKHTFQTFDDQGQNKKLIKQLHGTIKEHFHELADLNRQGAGVFFTVNETDLVGRSTKHIKKVRAVFIDLDGTPLPEKFDLNPHLIINTSPNKYHCYWLVKDMPLESFSLFQEALAIKFKSDSKVKDLPRIMRIAGFHHNKKEPYPVTIYKWCGDKPYTRTEIRDTLGLQKPKKKEYHHETQTYKGQYNGTLRYGTSKGDRHEKLVKMLIGIRLRGESYEYARGEALQFAMNCEPPESEREVMFQLDDIWRRYVPAA